MTISLDTHTQAVRLADFPLAKDWLNQFDFEDKPAATFLLDCLRPVSLAEFELTLKAELLKLSAKEKGGIAVFFSKKKIGRAPSRQVDSSAKLAYLFSKTEQSSKERIRVNPSLAQMRRARTKHVVFIDDIIASGSQMKRTWKTWLLSFKKESPAVNRKTLISWLSYKYFKPWILVYASTRHGTSTVLSECPAFAEENIISCMDLPTVDKIDKLCDKYGPRTGEDARYTYGYGQLSCPLVFQHGCPNNVPSILWASPSKRWRGLFPGRDVPVELSDWFTYYDASQRGKDLLNAANQRRLASTLTHHEFRNRVDKSLLLIITGLLARGNTLERINRNLTIPKKKANELVVELSRCGVLNTKYEVTPLGLELLKRSRLLRNSGSKKRDFSFPEEELYIPT